MSDPRPSDPRPSDPRLSDPRPTALLPAGLHDVLPPEAAHEAALVERLMMVFASHGYERVKPPLVEFEDSLFQGAGAAMASQTFRLMDPVSRRMMAVRADITPQAARIATTRLGNAPRPLRLCYAGEVLRVKGTQMRPERQFGQAGVELIGGFQPAADAEVILLAAAALRAVGVAGLSVDLAVPTLVPAVCRALDLPPEDIRRLRQALDHKDAAGVAAVGGPAAELAEKLMAASGPAARAIAALAALDLPEEARADRHRLTEVVRVIGETAPDLMVTVDPVEHRGFEYQTGVSFTFFARSVRGELGGGGRYRAGNGLEEGQPGEPATGFTLYLDTVLRAVPRPAPARRLFLPHGTPPLAAARLRDDGWITLAGLEPVADSAAEARRLNCDYVLKDGAAVPSSL